MNGARMVRIALPVLAVALVVAAGTRGAGILLPPTDLGYYDERMIRIAALAVAAVGLVVLLIQRRRGSAGEADSPARAFAVAAIIMWGLFAVSLPFYRGVALDGNERAEPAEARAGGDGDSTGGPPQGPPRPRPPADGRSQSGADVARGILFDDDTASTVAADIESEDTTGVDIVVDGQRAEDFDPEAEEISEPPPELIEEQDPDSGGAGAGNGFDSRGLLPSLRLPLPILLLALAVVLALWAQRGLPRLTKRPQGEAGSPVPEEDPSSETDGAEAQLAALLELAGEPGTPRHRIFISYAHLLEALGSFGGSRMAHEAPHEHLNRVLSPLDVRREPVHRLAELFVMARFGARPLKESDGTAAADALELSLGDLRTAAGQTPNDQQRPVAMEEAAS